MRLRGLWTVVALGGAVAAVAAYLAVRVIATDAAPSAVAATSVAAADARAADMRHADGAQRAVDTPDAADVQPRGPATRRHTRAGAADEASDDGLAPPPAAFMCSSAESGLPLLVETVDAETGRRVAVAGVSMRGAHGACVAHAAGRGATWFGDVVVRGGRVRACDLDIAVDPDSGFVLDPTRPFDRDVAVARSARALRLVLPTRREARILLRPTLPDGAPSEQPDDSWARAADWSATTRIELVFGGFLLRGVPYLRGERVRVGAMSAELSGAACISLPPRADEVCIVDLSLREHGPMDYVLGVANAIGCGGADVIVPTARVEVDVVDELGQPLADVAVSGPHGDVRRTDERGRVVFEPVHAGTWSVVLVEPGVAFGEAEVALLGEHETRRVTLRPTRTYDLDVVVVDAAGAPAPYAVIDVRSYRAVWVHLVDGIQTWQPRTDARGRCRLPALPWTSVNVTARFGSRARAARVEPGTPTATLRLPVGPDPDEP